MVRSDGVVVLSSVREPTDEGGIRGMETVVCFNVQQMTPQRR